MSKFIKLPLLGETPPDYVYVNVDRIIFFNDNPIGGTGLTIAGFNGPIVVNLDPDTVLALIPA